MWKIHETIPWEMSGIIPVEIFIAILGRKSFENFPRGIPGVLPWIIPGAICKDIVRKIPRKISGVKKEFLGSIHNEFSGQI